MKPDPFVVELSAFVEELDRLDPAARDPDWDAWAFIHLGRSLAGRVADESVDDVRGKLRAGYLVTAFWGLLGDLAWYSIGLTVDEQRLLVHLAAALDDDDVDKVRRLPTLSTEDIPLHHRFTAHGDPDTIDPGPNDEIMVRWMLQFPQVRRVLRAYRRPAGTAATQPPTWVYLVELDAGCYPVINTLSLRTGALEVFAQGEVLPRYHRDALDVAVHIWTRDDVTDRVDHATPRPAPAAPETRSRRPGR